MDRIPLSKKSRWKTLCIKTALDGLIKAQFLYCRCTSGVTIQELGACSQKKFKENPLAERKMNLKFSSFWLHRFQKMWKIRFWKSHGESGDTDEGEIGEDLPKSVKIEKISSYEICGMTSQDYYTVWPRYYCRLVETADPKKGKHSLNFIPCSNVTKIKNFEPIFFGNAKNSGHLNIRVE